jgi:serine/threonine protein kinase
MDNIIPEFEARYDTGSESDKTDAKNCAAENTAGKKFNIQISRTYPIVREFTHAGIRGDSYLIEQEGLQKILKFYRSDMIPNEEVIRKAKELSERLYHCIIRIHEYGFDENTRRWYVIQEYARYGSLKDLAESAINFNVLSRVVNQIIEGLKTLHENNMLHLNLKPSSILLRENNPPQAVFTDFYISSIIESGHMMEISPLGGKPLYSSPELLTGVAGREADYWSLGMILLELLGGGHPFDNLDGRSITEILSAKNVLIPEHISEDHKTLLRGLLTNDPGKRWGYAEVKRWLERDTNMPVYFSVAPVGPEEKISEGHAVPYKFLNGDYSSIGEMIPAFLKSEEAWEAAKDHLYQGNISKWLLKNSDEGTNSRVNNIRELSAGDPDLAVISLIYTFRNDLPFILYGKLVTRKNLHIYAGRSLKHESSKGEESIINFLLNGKLIEYYREYMMLTAKGDDELNSLFEAVRKAVSRKENNHEKLSALLKMLDILATPVTYMLPAKITDNVTGSLYFIADNVDVVITRETYDEMIGNLIIPEEMKEEIDNALSAGHASEYVKGLEKLREGSLLTKGELDKLQAEYILPVWLEGDLLGKEASRYMSATKRLRRLKEDGLFIKKNDLLDYFKKYFQYSGYVIDKTGTVQNSQKGETPEQRWMRSLRCDVTYEGYIRLARYIKNNVMLSVFPHIDEIIKRASTQAVSSDSMKETIAYLEALKSGEVKWYDADMQIVNETHSLIFRKNKGPIQFFEKMTEGVPGKILQTFMRIVIGIDADDRTREMESALAGVLGGACIGVIAWLIIAGLEPEASFYGPVVLGLLLGLIRKSIPLALFSASAGFAGVYFLGLETLIEVMYVFVLAVIGAATIGAFLGRRTNKFSFYDDIFRKYNDRINEVLNAAEAASG